MKVRVFAKIRDYFNKYKLEKKEEPISIDPKTDDDLAKVIAQIKKYHMSSAFKNPNDFNNWFIELTKKELNNFLSLDFNYEDIAFPTSLFIDKNLLNYDNYLERVKAMIKIKNGEGCYQLFSRLCNKEFMDSPNYFYDLDIISKAPTARYFLWIIGESCFINSPYHKEDMELLLNSSDPEHERDFLYWDALATVAGNADSINSPYHREDMRMIANAPSSALQMSSSFPESSINCLAINKVSLKDKYHSENMQILRDNPLASNYLYRLMTDKDFIKNHRYRLIVKLLASAKTETHALALYYYLCNPAKFDNFDLQQEMINIRSDILMTEAHLDNYNRLQGNANISKLKDEELAKRVSVINDVPESRALFIESLFSNKEFIYSNSFKEDLELLLGITDDKIFFDAYRVASNVASLTGPTHYEDLFLVCKMEDEFKRKLLVRKAIDAKYLKHINHKYDMNLIYNIDMSKMTDSILKKIEHFLFTQDGQEAIKHQDILRRLASGEDVEYHGEVEEYFTELEKLVSDGGKKPYRR